MTKMAGNVRGITSFVVYSEEMRGNSIQWRLTPLFVFIAYALLELDAPPHATFHDSPQRAHDLRRKT